MGKKHKKVYFSFRCYCMWFDFGFSLDGIPTGITCAAVGLNICALTAGIKKCKSTINNSNKKQWIVLLAKTKLNTIEVLFSRALFDSYISHDEFLLWNNVLRKYNDTKEEAKNLKASKVHERF